MSTAQIFQTRHILQSLIPTVLDTFPIFPKIVDNYLKNINDNTIKSDLLWLQESLNKDLDKIQDFNRHWKFLYADETITTCNEMFRAYQDLIKFIDVLIMEDLLTVLEGVNNNNNQFEMKECINKVKKWQISLNIVSNGIMNIQCNELSHEIDINDEQLNLIQKDIELRMNDFKQRIKDLQALV